MAEYLSEEDMNTGEYISRDEALKIFHQCCDNCTSSYNGVMCRACADADAMDILIDIPAADVQPVMHGKWKYYKNNGIIDTYICTNCQGKVEMTIDVESSKFKYCPNCGARMDIIYEDDKIRAIKVTGWR
jgi:predicted RNA-binding Zn-ribbon protein involved in translation (DUF1610 family)